MGDTWKASYRAQKEGATEGSRREKAVTDEELLSRYANLVKQRNGDDASRRPVGNLGDKVRPRKQMKDSRQRNSGEKRKRN